MLEFYLDFMDLYVDRSDFEYCEMDTDSAYMAIFGSNLSDMIKPEMRKRYHLVLKGFCTDKDIEAIGFHARVAQSRLSLIKNTRSVQAGIPRSGNDRALHQNVHRAHNQSHQTIQHTNYC